MPLPKALKDLLTLPTAPFRESAVLTYLERACHRLPGVQTRYDRHGNLLAHYRCKPRGTRPLVFAAHTDHPGFAAREMLDRRTLRADFRGGVRPEYFPGARVRFWADGTWIRGRVVELTKVDPPAGPGRPPVPKEARLRVSRPVPPDALGMWDLPEATLKGDRVVARACDDLAGVAAVLALLQRLSGRRAAAEVYALFTRAEEVGFVGAVAAARARTIPQRLPVLSIETSSALPHAPIGEGPIVRVGDRASIYTPGLEAFCTRVAGDLAKRRRSFRHQRRLMDGGMCEASAFGCYGHDVMGICLALGNYHNMNTRTRRIDSEYVSLRDWHAMVALFEALVLDPAGPGRRENALRRRIDKLYADCRRLL